MQINYYIKSVYGNDLKYISGDETEKAIQQLTGKETIDDDDIEALEQLGHEVNRVGRPTVETNRVGRPQ